MNISKDTAIIELSMGNKPLDEGKYANGGYSVRDKLTLHGRSNEFMGNIGYEFGKQGYTIIPQWEIDDVIQAIRSYYPVPTLETFPVKLADGKKYIDTLDVLKGAKVITDAKGIKRVLLIGYKWHLPRIWITAWKIGLRPVWPKGYWNLIKRIPLDKDSGQRWTRTPWAFIKSEWMKLVVVILSLRLYITLRDKNLS